MHWRCEVSSSFFLFLFLFLFALGSVTACREAMEFGTQEKDSQKVIKYFSIDQSILVWNISIFHKEHAEMYVNLYICKTLVCSDQTWYVL